MELPQDFIKQMEQELGTQYPAFLAAYEQPAWRGLRFNGQKGVGKEERADAALPGEPIPWCPRGRCLSEEEAGRWSPGKHPLHFAGAYYIQEPSAMLPAELLDVRPGERVLDLCAAPGGKSTQLIDAMGDSGLLVSNDISASRGRAIVKNLERFGVRRFLVTAEEPKRLAEAFPAFFDKILVDAPCSGEGMFRREPSMCRQWQEKGPAFYQPLQREILAQAGRLLRPGGRLVYSTCTFNRQEDEENAAWLEQTHPGLRLLKEEKLWPHRCRGEGQYAALFEREAGGDGLPDAMRSAGAVPGEEAGVANPGGMRLKDAVRSRRGLGAGAARLGSADRLVSGGSISREQEETVRRFFDMTENCAWQTENWYEQKGQLYELPMPIHGLKHLRFLRTGLLLGEFKKNRFEPSQALAMALKKEQFANTVDFAPADGRVIRYLKGETIETSGAENRGGAGWCLVLCGGLPLGWAKRAGDSLKNYYAPGWRLQ